MYLLTDRIGGSGRRGWQRHPARVADLWSDLRASPDYRLPPPVPVTVALSRPAELVDIVALTPYARPAPFA